ncbi:hypothetical protein [Mycoplasmopsis columbinasalis]|uniref:Uncharacterized protein n=1 Tax=Mycoplasmopsis columbinasalis TaxID=114880 RepID=A0A449BAZ4_9BACT|nr:hypothetical protein [Mycoplasmopsis columbinasalis]VEU78387.1 Uncharacterised protein [Mycoplasmopsis columbinasalis]
MFRPPNQTTYLFKILPLKSDFWESTTYEKTNYRHNVLIIAQDKNKHNFYFVPLVMPRTPQASFYALTVQHGRLKYHLLHDLVYRIDQQTFKNWIALNDDEINKRKQIAPKAKVQIWDMFAPRFQTLTNRLEYLNTTYSSHIDPAIERFDIYNIGTNTKLPSRQPKVCKNLFEIFEF